MRRILSALLAVVLAGLLALGYTHRKEAKQWVSDFVSTEVETCGWKERKAVLKNLDLRQVGRDLFAVLSFDDGAVLIVPVERAAAFFPRKRYVFCYNPGTNEPTLLRLDSPQEKNG